MSGRRPWSGRRPRAAAALRWLQILAIALGLPALFVSLLHLWPVQALVRVEATTEVLEIESDLARETNWWVVAEAASVVRADGTVEAVAAPADDGRDGAPLVFRGSVRIGLETTRPGIVAAEFASPERCRVAANGAGEPPCHPATAWLGGRRVDLDGETLVLELRGGPESPSLAFRGAVVLGGLAGDARVAPPRLLREGRVATLARDVLGSTVFEAGARVLLPGDRVRFASAGAGGRQAEGDGILRLAEDGAIRLVFHAAAGATRIVRADLEPIVLRASALARLGNDPLFQVLAPLFLAIWGTMLARLVDRAVRSPARDAPAPAGGLLASAEPPKDERRPSRISAMQPFTTLRGTAAPFPAINVDTDKIIPARHLKTIKRTGLGVALFETLRFDDQGRERPDFVLNQERYRRAQVLIAGENFGCGSSREHAPWALLDYGIRCVIAPSFADIFYNNAFKNGMLLITLPPEDVELLAKEAETAADPTFEIDLERQEIRRPTGNAPIRFDIDPFKKHCLLNGLDEVGLTMEKVDKIAGFEARRRREMPWLEPARG